MTNNEQEIVDVLSDKIYVLVRAKFLKHGNNIDNKDRKVESISPRCTFIEAKILLYDRTEHPKQEDKGMIFYIVHYKNPFNAADGCAIYVMRDDLES